MKKNKAVRKRKSTDFFALAVAAARLAELKKREECEEECEERRDLDSRQQNYKHYSKPVLVSLKLPITSLSLLLVITVLPTIAQALPRALSGFGDRALSTGLQPYTVPLYIKLRTRAKQFKRFE